MTEKLQSGSPSQEQLVAFIAHEAQLIDEQHFEQWLDLFAPDAHYWVPVEPSQTDPQAEPALAYEDMLLLRIRVDRLKHPQAHSQRPASRCVHVLQRSQLLSADDTNQCWQLRTPFTYAEQRGDQQFQLTGVATHQLTLIDDHLRIQQKRVDILGASAAVPMIQLFP